MPQERKLYTDPSTKKKKAYTVGSAEHRELVTHGVVTPPEGKKLRKDGKAFIPMKRGEKLSKADHRNAVKEGKAQAPEGMTLSKSGKRFVKVKVPFPNPESKYAKRISNLVKKGVKSFNTDSKDFTSVQFRGRIYINNSPTALTHPKLRAYGKRWWEKATPVDIVLPVKTAKKIKHLLAVGQINEDVCTAQYLKDLLATLPQESGAHLLLDRLLILLEYNYDWSDIMVSFDNVAYGDNLTALPQTEPGDWPLAFSRKRSAIATDKYEYNIKQSETFAGMFYTNAVDPNIEFHEGGRCFIQYLVAIFRNAHASYGKKYRSIMDLSTEDAEQKIFNVMFPGKLYPETGDVSVTLNQAVPFFELYKLRVFAYGVPPDYKTLWQFGERANDSNWIVRPSTLHFVISGNHIYPLNTYQIAQPDSHDRNSSLVASSWYRLPQEQPSEPDKKSRKKKNSPKRMYTPTLINNPDDICYHIWSEEGKECNTFSFFVQCPRLRGFPELVDDGESPMDDMMVKLCHGGYIPKVVSIDRTPVGKLVIDNLKRHGDEEPVYITIQEEPVAPGKKTTAVATNGVELREFLKVKEDYRKKVLSHLYISTYSPEFMELLNNFKLGGIKGSFITQDEYDKIRSLTELDMSKAYTNSVMQITHVPIFNYHDRPYNYDNHPIEDLTMYLLEFNSLDNFVYRQYHLAFGVNVKKFQPQIKLIHQFVRPSRIAECNFQEDIKSVFECPITENGKKFLANCTTGLLGRSHNKRTRTNIFFNRDECLTHRSRPNTSVFERSSIVDGEIVHFWTLTDFAERELQNGFLALYMLTLENHCSVMYETRKVLESQGVRAVYTITDALLVDSRDEMKVSLPWKDSGLSQFENIGKWGKSPKDKPSWKPPQAYRQPEMVELQEQTVTVIQPSSEWDQEAIREAIDLVISKPGSRGRLYIHAPPGCGKSFNAFDYARSRGIKTLVLTAWNSTRILADWDDEDKQTACTFSTVISVVTELKDEYHY